MLAWASFYCLNLSIILSGRTFNQIQTQAHKWVKFHPGLGQRWVHIHT